MYGTYHIYDFGKGIVRYHATYTDKDKLVAAIKSWEYQDPKIILEKEEPTKSAEQPVDSKDSFGQEINLFITRLYSYYDLFLYFTDVIPSLSRYMYKDKVVYYAKNNFEKLEECDGFPIYKLDEDTSKNW